MIYEGKGCILTIGDKEIECNLDHDITTTDGYLSDEALKDFNGSLDPLEFSGTVNITDFGFYPLILKTKSKQPRYIKVWKAFSYREFISGLTGGDV